MEFWFQYLLQCHIQCLLCESRSSQFLAFFLRPFFKFFYCTFGIDCISISNRLASINLNIIIVYFDLIIESSLNFNV